MHHQGVIKRQRIALLVLFYVLMQASVMYISTHHAFMAGNMPLLCPACVAADSFDRLAVGTGTGLLLGKAAYIPAALIVIHHYLFFRSHYQSRAPPSSFSG